MTGFADPHLRTAALGVAYAIYGYLRIHLWHNPSGTAGVSIDLKSFP